MSGGWVASVYIVEPWKCDLYISILRRDIPVGTYLEYRVAGVPLTSGRRRKYPARIFVFSPSSARFQRFRLARSRDCDWIRQMCR